MANDFEGAEIDFDAVERQLVRAMRGSRPQADLSQQMGYTFNQISKWEAGTKRLRWLEFVALAKVCCDGRLAEALGEFFGYRADPGDVSALLNKIVGGQSIAASSRFANVSRQAMQKWLGGETLPSVAQILRLMRIHRGGIDHVAAFAARLVDLESVPALMSIHASNQQLYEVVYEHPWVFGLFECMELEAYQRLSDGHLNFLAKKIKIPAENLRDVLTRLIALGAVGKKNGRYFAKRPNLKMQEYFLSEARDISGNIAIRKYWLQRSVEYLDENPDWRTLKFAVLPFAASDATFDKIRKLSIRYFLEVQAALNDDRQPKTAFKVLNLHILD